MLLAALFSLDLDSDTKEVWKHIKERYGNVQRLVEELHTHIPGINSGDLANIP